ncbi:hypothetical protein SAMN05428995_10419 [Loktanella sp. DSM 29012]|uniref:hypothetical protein n=1 Tax=Loktanella sp. DSM 29012 TaxID=1881056 RepID=UPI0008CCE7C5|nr:hypothetical protein [Loktanella sp. DSM 29012]SEQ35982.1 hypothetical protein SAMN05428995_10419 [Loktanella sp. DSM 29012]
MPRNLILTVEHGTASTGRKLTLSDGRPSIGGRGSGATHELVDVPAGLVYLQFERSEDDWFVEEVTNGAARLNDGPLRRTNKLAAGNVLTLPRSDQAGAVQLSVRFKSERAGFTMPTAREFMDGPYFYGLALVCMMIAGLLFMAIQDQPGTGGEGLTPAIIEEEVIALLRDETGEVARDLPGGQPRTLQEARLALRGAPDAETRDRIAADYASEVIVLMSEARRLERMRLYDEARAAYSQVVTRVGDLDARVSQTALQALNRLN